MYIKIERSDKIQMHHVKSYYSNECGGGLDFNFERIDGAFIQERIEQGEKVDIFIMNENGKTIDRI